MGENINIKEIWKIIKKNFYIPVLSVVIFGFSAFLYSKFSKPVYRATGKIYVGPSKIEIKSLNDVILTDYGERVIKTQIEIMKSSQVLKLAGEKLKLTQSYEGEDLDFLMKNISVSMVEGTYIIEVSSEYNSPQLARDMVNAIISAYFEFQKNTFTMDISNTLISITDRLTETKERLKKLEESLISFVKSNDVEDENENDNSLSKIKSLLVEKKTELIFLRSRYGDKHPLVITKEKEMKGMERLYEEEKKKEIEERERAIRFSILQRDVEAEREVYNTLLREMKRIDTLGNIKDMDIKLVESAKLPLHPVKPRPLRSSFFGAFVGLMFGIMIIFLLVSIDTTIEREGDIEENYNLPVLLSVSHIKFENFSEILKDNHPLYERFYSLLTLAGFISPDPKTFLVVSGTKDEGKTFVSFLFSSSLAKGGNKVLLIDMDFKGQKLKEILGVKGNYGLCDCLIGTLLTKDAIFETGIKNLHFLPSGNSPPIGPSLLLRTGFQRLYKELKESYDYIIIDTPPLLFYSHPLEIMNFVDFVLLVVRAGMTTKQDLKRTISMLKSCKAKAMGVVFNYAEEKRYYYRYYYSS